MSIPRQVIAGDHYEFTEAYGEYPATSGWTAKLYLVGINPQSVNATPDGSSFKFTIPSTVSKDWTPDLYRASIRVTLAGVEHTVDESTIEVIQNPATAPPGTDIRTHARKVLDAIKATMEGRATKEHESSMVGPPGGMQTQVSLLSPQDLVYWFNVYSTMVDREEQEDLVNKGNQGKRYYTRFDPVP